MISSIFHYKYKLCKSRSSVEEISHIGYGIAVIDRALHREILRIENISTSKTKMTALIKACNRLQLSPLHIYEVIEDCLQSC